MASLAEILDAQACILRTQLNAEAQAVAAAGTPLDTYVEELIERAAFATQPALVVYEFVTSATPTSVHLDELTAFAEQQFSFYRDVLGVANPALGPYEAIGRGLWQVVELQPFSFGKTDAEFITAVYVAASDPGAPAPSAAQIQHFQNQIDFFETLYQSTGIPAADAAQQARGAVLGQIIGLFAMQEGSQLDLLAENWFRTCVANTFRVYDIALEAVADINDPDVPPPVHVIINIPEEGDGFDVSIDEFDVASVVSGYLTFTGDGDLHINAFINEATDPLSQVNMANFTGSFYFSDDIGNGTDILIGNLQDEQSRLELGGAASSSIRFVGSDMSADELYIENFDVRGAEADLLDFGELVTSMADLEFTFVAGGDVEITANADQFSGTIQVDTAVGQSITGPEDPDFLALLTRIELE